MLWLKTNFSWSRQNGMVYGHAHSLAVCLASRWVLCYRSWAWAPTTTSLWRRPNECPWVSDDWGAKMKWGNWNTKENNKLTYCKENGNSSIETLAYPSILFFHLSGSLDLVSDGPPPPSPGLLSRPSKLDSPRNPEKSHPQLVQNFQTTDKLSQIWGRSPHKSYLLAGWNIVAPNLCSLTSKQHT